MFFYLVFAVLLATGQPAATIATPYATQEECNAAGDAGSAKVVADDRVDRAAWQCLAIDFSLADPKPDAPHTEKLLPGDRGAALATSPNHG